MTQDNPMPADDQAHFLSLNTNRLPTLYLGPGSGITKMTAIHWSHGQTCRARINFGNLYNVQHQGTRVDQMTLMSVDCYLGDGHAGPHKAWLDKPDDPMTDTGQIADHQFTLTWEEAPDAR